MNGLVKIFFSLVFSFLLYRLYLVAMVPYVLYLESVCCACFYGPRFIFPVELDVEHVINDIKVMLLEADHCPGAAMIHFLLPDGRCYLHTGDF